MSKAKAAKFGQEMVDHCEFDAEGLASRLKLTQVKTCELRKGDIIIHDHGAHVVTEIVAEGSDLTITCHDGDVCTYPKKFLNSKRWIIPRHWVDYDQTSRYV